jgi:hypothetical protein
MCATGVKSIGKCEKKATCLLVPETKPNQCQPSVARVKALDKETPLHYKRLAKIARRT